MAGRRARARSARFECGVGMARADSTRLRRGVEVVDAVCLRFLDGVWGGSGGLASAEPGSERSAWLDVSLTDSSLYSPSLPAPDSVSAFSSTHAGAFVRRFRTGSAMTAHGAPELHCTSSPWHVGETTSGGRANKVHNTTHVENPLH